MEQQEIERKFIVSYLPEQLLDNAPNSEVEQGYLLLENNRELRIRKRNSRFWMTLKQGSGLERFEQEERITAALYAMLWPLTEGKRIGKVRYLVEDGGHTLEIDVFSDTLSPLIILEVEFNSVEESQNFKVPDFARKEVTEDKAYKNAALATCGLPNSFYSGG